jgi:predicted transcriptional regulator
MYEEEEAGVIIKETLVNRGITPKTLSEDLNISLQSVYNIISGRSHKKIIIKKIYDYLNINTTKHALEDRYNTNIYNLSTKLVCEHLIKEQINNIASDSLLELIDQVYKFALIDSSEENELKFYAIGLVNTSLKNKLVDI